MKTVHVYELINEKYFKLKTHFTTQTVRGKKAMIREQVNNE